jgi:hypothetical protein
MFSFSFLCVESSLCYFICVIELNVPGRVASLEVVRLRGRSNREQPSQKRKEKRELISTQSIPPLLSLLSLFILHSSFSFLPPLFLVVVLYWFISFLFFSFLFFSFPFLRVVIHLLFYCIKIKRVIVLFLSFLLLQQKEERIKY